MTARELVECPVVVGTAGHVDHGKSALIEALTGKNPDRLEVERRRGMTTELGFGELELPGGKIVGLVDVPGHAHYLRAMVQGATGVDVALLVVSAVEGVMPQTREHVRALELLGVTRMVVALTMRDLADDEIATLAELDVEAFLDGTVFAGASIVPVSSKTGEGLDELLTVLDNAVCSCWSEHLEAVVGSGAAPRLPIDRCFSIRGTGTVVTGTLHDGPVSVGDELVALPSQTCCRVRGGGQVHGDTQCAVPGQRVALNLVGDGVAGLKRGEMLGVEGRVGQTLRFLMQLTYVGRDGVRSGVLASGTRMHVMAGTAEVLGRIMLLDDEPPIAVGETRVVQVRLERPLPLRVGDQAVILSYSPVSLLGGGRVLLSHRRRARALSAGERAACAPSTAPRCSTRIPLLRRYAWYARLASVSLPCWTRLVLMRRRFPRWASSFSSIATP
ncbi:selenocysteine-specific translation elongation factor [Collinsella sp. AF38-3AC]|uniref:selenocysteine-specific translation elongation factor n=1 Tax=Collinsella sp. AF38-3AC TaxID=2292015 RepID=UPI000E4FFB5F|nr:selenocysteine-specific translation elongation factor [Collinsella sp. AF38-3AC]RHL23205.1 selenocysteine-specific translation elongation factor [Collinsella sp. AF38-3AC]